MRTRTGAWRAGRRRAMVLMVSALVLVAGCDAATPTPLPDASATPPPGAGPSGAGGPSPSTGAGPGPAAEEVPSSSSLIEAAQRAGTIDHDTALLYQLYSALDYGSLPAAYQSDNASAPDATRILAELSLRSMRMAPDLQAKVGPFFKRPSDPGSIWAGRFVAARTPGRAALAADTAVVGCPDRTMYTGCVDADSRIRVWYEDLPGMAEKATALADEIDGSEMWAKEQAAMPKGTVCSDADLTGASGLRNGGNGRLDIYLLPTGGGASGNLDFAGRTAALGLPDGSVANGVAVPDGTDSCGVIPFLVLNADRPVEDLAWTTAHELFHAFQFSFQNALERNRDWWAEASATWARDLVYPASNDEQSYLDGYWSRAAGAAGPLDRFDYGQPAQYAAYLWAFYLRQKTASTNGSIIGRLWKASETEDPIHVMEALDGWADMFKEFALWNWNNDDPELVRYRDEPDGVIPSTVLTQTTSCMSADGCETSPDGSSRSILANGTHDVPIDARYTSVQYLAGAPEVDVGELRFDLGGVLGKPGIGIQAILWTGDAPAKVRVEDWSDRTERRICIDSEDVRKIVLVVSNSAVDPVGDFKGTITADATADGCPPVTSATAMYTKDATGAGRHTWSRLSMVVVNADGSTTATVDYQWDSVETTASGTIRESVRGSGTVDASIVCSMAADGTVGVETSWTDAIPSTRTRTYDGVGAPEASFLEFQGFIVRAQGNPNKKATSGTRTEDGSSADGVDIAVYTWDCPNPDRVP